MILNLSVKRPAIAAAEAAYEERALDGHMAPTIPGRRRSPALPAFALPLRFRRSGSSRPVTAHHGRGQADFCRLAIAVSLGLANVGGGKSLAMPTMAHNIGNANLGNNNLGSGSFNIVARPT